MTCKRYYKFNLQWRSSSCCENSSSFAISFPLALSILALNSAHTAICHQRAELLPAVLPSAADRVENQCAEFNGPEAGGRARFELIILAESVRTTAD
jgi:hypothetical protein